MNIDEAIERVKDAGFGGICMWMMGSQHMACLLRSDLSVDYSTNLWNWVDTAQEALNQIVEKAERLQKLESKLEDVKRHAQD